MGSGRHRRTTGPKPGGTPIAPDDSGWKERELSAEKAAPVRRPKAKANSWTETADYVAALHRLIDSLEDRMAEDPAALVYCDGLREHMTEAQNAAMARSSRADGGTYSMSEVGAILGMGKGAVHKRVESGRAVIAERLASLGVTSLRELGRGKKPQRGIQHFRDVQAEALASAGVTDLRLEEKAKERWLRSA
jgi:hypothetical protein